MSETLSTNNTVFFSTTNDSYISHSATSLLSVRHFLPNAKLYIISRQISPKNKKFLRNLDINYIEIDLTYLFFQSWDCSIEQYYMFAGPKLFSDLGFKYSIYLDSNAICLKNPLENLPSINDIGGMNTDTYDKIFPLEKKDYSDKFNIPTKDFSGHAISSNLVYLNNLTLNKLKFLETCGKLYYETWNMELPLKEKGSLFALFQLINYSKLNPTILKNLYNKTPSKINSSTFFFQPSANYPQKQNKSSLKKICKYINQFSFVLKRTRYPLIKKRFNLKKTPINLYWWEPSNIKNFGDVVSQDIILNIFGREVQWCPINTCDLIATGSILEIAEQTIRQTDFYSWGSGFIDEFSSDKNLDKIIFAAVRGEKTLSRIKQKVPLGDPGLLINSTYCLKRKRHSKKIGVVIHYADMQTPIAKKFCEDPRFEVITPLDNPKNVAEKIANCGLVLSSSLHGLIFADSLSIPNIHIKIADNLAGGVYKFLDYYSGIGKPYRSADIKKIFDNNYLQELKNTYKPVSRLTKIQRRLIKAFPFN